MYKETLWVLLLFVECVETSSIVSTVTCTSDGDVYIHSGGQSTENVNCLFATSGNTVCDQEQSAARLRIYGCVEPDSDSTLDMYLRNDTDSLWIVGIQCATDQDRRRRLTYEIPSDFEDTRQYQPGAKLTSDRHLRRRRQDSPSDKEEIKTTHTSVSFEVKLNYSSNDEISIACDPDGAGILYLSNPNPDFFRSTLAFSDLSRRRCNSEFLSDRTFVAVGGCNLNFPITVAFSFREKHAPVIGGSMSNFKVYNINCSDPLMIARGNVFSDAYDYAAGNSLRLSWVAMATAVLTVMLVYVTLFCD